MIDDLAQGDAAEQRAEEALLPAAAVGAVEQSHAEVTGEVRPLSKHRVLHVGTLVSLNQQGCGARARAGPTLLRWQCSPLWIME